ncbi:MAG: transglutaminaseTgpA domain-containing protein [Phycisphaeraceae bacterium]
MDLIYLFRKLVFAQVLLGIVAFCMAEQNPEMLLIAGALVSLSWYVVEGPTGKPLPQWIILVGALGAVAWLLMELWYFRQPNVIKAVGHFTMWLQVLQLYAQKTNRDYALLLVLSLLQMVGASVLSVSIIFGTLLAAYCVLSLFTVLLFQLKTTSDLVFQATKAQAPDAANVDRPKVIVGRGHRWQLRLTAGMIGLICGITAVVIFIILPRTSRFDEAMGGDTDYLGRPRQVGFTREIQLGGAPMLPGSKEPVLNIVLSSNAPGFHSGSGAVFHVRGAALDTYNPTTKTWSRGPGLGWMDVAVQVPALPETKTLAELSEGAPVIEASFTLRTSQMRTIFTLFPVSSIASSSLSSVIYSPMDQQMSATSNTTGAVVYQTRSPISADAKVFESIQELTPPPAMPVGPAPGEWPYGRRRRGTPPFSLENYARSWPQPNAVMTRLAFQIIHEAGLDRDVNALSDPRDAQIAKALCDYLQNNYRYSLTNASESNQPITDFLVRQKSGHCELFASGLAALARSIGMRARVVTGYLAHDYNAIGGYYVVRDADAHAWTEIECADAGWQTFDASPLADVYDELQIGTGWFTWFRQLYEHVEFAWLSSFVAYDKETRHAMLTGLQTSFTDASQNQDTWLGMALLWIKGTIDNWRFDMFTYSFMSVILLSIMVGVVSLIHRMMVHRRRLVALQLTRLPSKERRTLSRRLRFYLIMLDILERHGYHRPAWQTPFGFAHQLAESDTMRFEPVIALTEHFYEIRFGHRELDDTRRRIIRAHLTRLQESLGQRR